MSRIKQSANHRNWNNRLKRKSYAPFNDDHFNDLRMCVLVINFITLVLYYVVYFASIINDGSFYVFLITITARILTGQSFYDFHIFGYDLRKRALIIDIKKTEWFVIAQSVNGKSCCIFKNWCRLKRRQMRQSIEMICYKTPFKISKNYSIHGQ